MEGPKASIQILSDSQQQTLTGSYHWGNVLDANNINGHNYSYVLVTCYKQTKEKYNVYEMHEASLHAEEDNWEGKILV